MSEHGGRPMTLGEIAEAEGFGTLGNETAEARLAREAQQVDHDAWMRAQAQNPLVLSILERLDAIEAAIELSHADREEFSKNDLPYLDLVVQRAAKECIVPTALQTDIKGRFFRAGMATMLAWLRDHPEELRGHASRLDDLGRVVPAPEEEG